MFLKTNYKIWTYAVLFLLTYLIIGIVRIVYGKGSRVNIYEQPAKLSRGAGDISNLWVGFAKGSFLPRSEMRNALKPNSPNRWTRYVNSQGQYVIPYILQGKFDDSEHSTITRAMLAITQNTCIKFQKRAGEADFIELKNERGEGCYTTVGRTSGKNVVMLETNTIATCLEFDIVVHELMHTIGLWHEQMRFDRDNYIKIHYENISPVYYTQFEKIPETDSTIYGVKYDYESVMHYAKNAFASEPGKLTMETLNKDFQDVIGKMKDASPNDYIKICNIYSCKKCMGRPFTSIHSNVGQHNDFFGNITIVPKKQNNITETTPIKKNLFPKKHQNMTKNNYYLFNHAYNVSSIMEKFALHKSSSTQMEMSPFLKLIINAPLLSKLLSSNKFHSPSQERPVLLLPRLRLSTKISNNVNNSKLKNFRD